MKCNSYVTKETKDTYSAKKVRIMTHKKITILILCVVCVFTLILSGFVTKGSSFTVDGTVPLYLNGIKMTDGLLSGDTTYVSVKTFAETMSDDAQINYDSDTATVTVTAPGLELTATKDSPYVVANGRYLLVDGGVVSYNGEMLLPIRTLGKIFGADIEWDDTTSSISIICDEMTPIKNGNSYYNSTDLYWLSRLINSEAGNQPLEGKIAVGNVVLNRVADPSCPDNVHDVVFDTKYGVQFSVVSTGGIYAEPNEESVIAAKICLDGGSVVSSDCIYFVNPSTGVTSWFKSSRTYICTIGDHDFYA